MIESSSTKLHFVVLSSIVEAGVFEQHFECLESIKLFRMFVGQQIVLEHFECLGEIRPRTLCRMRNP